MYTFNCQLDNSHNNIIMLLTNPRLTEVRYQSSMRSFLMCTVLVCIVCLLLMDLKSGKKVYINNY